MNTINETKSGHAVWLDTIDRAMIESGQLEDLIDAGVTGVTSRPMAFTKIIRYRNDYDGLLRQLSEACQSVKQMVEAVIFDDIQRTADYLHPVFDRSAHTDGYVSLDVNPALDHKTDSIVSEGLRLADDVDRVNVMIQVPATASGIPAIETLISEGVNVNATFIFSPDTYQAVAEAYVTGLERFLDTLDIWPKTPASVASIPISQLDNSIDQALSKIDAPEARNLKGKIGEAVARVVYSHYQSIFSSKRWQRLAKAGAHVQRPLWADSSAPYYLGTINSLLPAALNPFLARGQVEDSSLTVEEAGDRLTALEDLGIDLAAVAERLQSENLAALNRSFQRLAQDIMEKRDLLATLVMQETKKD